MLDIKALFNEFKNTPDVVLSLVIPEIPLDSLNLEELKNFLNEKPVAYDNVKYENDNNRYLNKGFLDNLYDRLNYADGEYQNGMVLIYNILLTRLSDKLSYQDLLDIHLAPTNKVIKQLALEKIESLTEDFIIENLNTIINSDNEISMKLFQKVSKELQSDVLLVVCRETYFLSYRNAAMQILVDKYTDMLDLNDLLITLYSDDIELVQLAESLINKRKITTVESRLLLEYIRKDQNSCKKFNTKVVRPCRKVKDHDYVIHNFILKLVRELDLNQIDLPYLLGEFSTEKNVVNSINILHEVLIVNSNKLPEKYFKNVFSYLRSNGFTQNKGVTRFFLTKDVYTFLLKIIISTLTFEEKITLHRSSANGLYDCFNEDNLKDEDITFKGIFDFTFYDLSEKDKELVRVLIARIPVDNIDQDTFFSHRCFTYEESYGSRQYFEHTEWSMLKELFKRIPGEDVDLVKLDSLKESRHTDIQKQAAELYRIYSENNEQVHASSILSKILV